MRKEFILCTAALAGLLFLAGCGVDMTGDEFPYRVTVDPSLANIVYVDHQLAKAGTLVKVGVKSGAEDILYNNSFVYGDTIIEIPENSVYGAFTMPRKDIHITMEQTKWHFSSVAPAADFVNTIGPRAKDGYRFYVDLAANGTQVPTVLNSSGKKVTVIIRDANAIKTLTLSGSGSLFTLLGGVTLMLDGIVTLEGHSSNNAPLIQVGDGSRLLLNWGTIRHNGSTSSSNDGGGVYVGSGGTFTMTNGTITANYAGRGGGVYVCPGGTFTMNGGSISGNFATSYGWGGGVFVDTSAYYDYYSNTMVSNPGTFIMNGGTIQTNTASRGGGVYVHYDGYEGYEGSSGVFVKSGGAIEGGGTGSSNIATSGSGNGHAAYLGAGAKYRDATADPGDYLDSRNGAGFLP
ncbi:MAG: hypothetical protein LBQ55_03485 [Treponema sp.]|nr:hypothetical protein [Treponema sp.]